MRRKSRKDWPAGFVNWFLWPPRRRAERLPRKQGEPIGVPQVQGESLPEFTASDVLSSKLWQPRPDRPPLGIDLACTKIAVDFQNITAGNADAVIRQSLDILREATGTDAVFLALLDGHGERIESIATAKGPFAQCRPEVLKGEALEALPWIRSRLEHVRILEIRDTVSARAEQAGRRRPPRGSRHPLAAPDRLRGAGHGARLPRLRIVHAPRRLGREPAPAAQARRHEPRLRPREGRARGPARRHAGAPGNGAARARTTGSGTTTRRATRPGSRRAGRACSASPRAT